MAGLPPCAMVFGFWSEVVDEASEPQLGYKLIFEVRPMSPENREGGRVEVVRHVVGLAFEGKGCYFPHVNLSFGLATAAPTAGRAEILSWG